MPIVRGSVELGAPAYRAPEALFGNPEFGSAVDLWCLGAVVCDMVCEPLVPRNARSLAEVATGLFQRLGTPASVPPGWPACPKISASAEGTPMPEPAARILGVAGLILLAGLLQYDPATRLTAAQCLDTAYCNPSRMTLSGLLASGPRKLRTGTCSAAGPAKRFLRISCGSPFVLLLGAGGGRSLWGASWAESGCE